MGQETRASESAIPAPARGIYLHRIQSVIIYFRINIHIGLKPDATIFAILTGLPVGASMHQCR